MNNQHEWKPMNAARATQQPEAPKHVVRNEAKEIIGIEPKPNDQPVESTSTEQTISQIIYDNVTCNDCESSNLHGTRLAAEAIMKRFPMRVSSGD